MNKVLKFLIEGESFFVQGSAKKPYEIKMRGAVVSCDCPAWKNLGGGLDTRVCKHIKANIDPGCLLPQAVVTAKVQAVKAAGPRLTKTGKISTAVGGAVMKDTAPPVLLAHKWEDEDISGWWMSEKLDGVRAWWDGENFISRLGNTYHAPDWFKKLLSQGFLKGKKVVLDGELWIGRGKFQQTISTVRKLVPTDSEWMDVTYVIFDAPRYGEGFEQRMMFLTDTFPVLKTGSGGGVGQICVLDQTKCKNTETLKAYLTKIEHWNGEGVMLREPGSLYEEGRSKTLLKVKSFFDAEARVIEHLPGRGKHKGRMGALLVKMLSGKKKEFQVGSGFTDKERENPPKVGSTITYRYQELSVDGIPRFPTFLREYISF